MKIEGYSPPVKQNMNMTIFFLIIFTVIGITNIAAIFLRNEKLRQISKCLIIPPLLAAYIAGGGSWIYPIPALILGWTGDVLLLRINKKICFLAGLGSFLLGHIFYIITFAFILGASASTAISINIPAILIFTPPACVLGMIVFRLIKPTREMYAPVIVYMVVLLMMSFFGFQVFLAHPELAGLLILSGSFNFMVSDTILAYYTFRKPKIYGSVLIMAYYVLAQAEIVIGLLLLARGRII